MKSQSRFILVALLALVAATTEAVAQPDLATSIVPNVRVSPGGGVSYSCTILDAAGLPLDPAPIVTLSWPPAAAVMTCWCAGQPTPLVVSPTDAAGMATFGIAAGGCINPATAFTGVDVLVDGVYFTTVGQVSTDQVNAAGAPVPNCAVGLSDAVAFTLPLATATYAFCCDLNTDLAVGIADAVIVTPALRNASACVPAP